MQNRKDEGFTLIELLIVIVILGILATIVVFAVGGVTDRGQQSACDADRASLEVAVEAYYAQTGSYPATEVALTTGAYKFLRSVSDTYDVGDLGAVTASVGGECV